MRILISPAKTRFLVSGILAIGFLSAAIAENRPDSFLTPGPEMNSNDENKISAFSQLRLSEDQPGILRFIPQSGELKILPQEYGCSIKPGTVESKPGYYSVVLADNNIKVDFTALNKVAVYRLTFPEESKEYNVVIDIGQPLDQFKGGEIELWDSQTIEGFGTYLDSDHKEFKIYFCFHFSKGFRNRGIWTNDTIERRNTASMQESLPFGAYANFWTNPGETILLKIGVSEVDIETARQNMQEEFPGWDFKQLVSENR